MLHVLCSRAHGFEIPQPCACGVDADLLQPQVIVMAAAASTLVAIPMSLFITVCSDVPFQTVPCMRLCVFPVYCELSGVLAVYFAAEISDQEQVNNDRLQIIVSKCRPTADK
jgi:hypothetical protein